jgi:hypothetical protein
MNMKGLVPEGVAQRKLYGKDWDFGQLAYEAFTRARTASLAQGEDPFDAQFQEWETLEQEQRDAWAWSARAVRYRVFKELE